MKQNLKWIIPVGIVVVLACVVCVGGTALLLTDQGLQKGLNLNLFLTPSSPSSGSASSGNTLVSTAQAVAPSITQGSMQDLLKQHNGQTCTTNYELTCITLTMPLDHNDSSNTKTVDVTFGVLPATGERFGMFFQAYPGGPGGAGIASSEGQIDDTFDKKILEHYDIVYFDQRGVGLSSPLSCPNTLAADRTAHFSDYDKDGVEGPDTPKEQQGAIDSAKKLDEACVKEIGIPPEDLKLYETAQVIEDIESFRQAVGDDKMFLYGVSYGTEVAQMYAAAHADHLAGLILDGTLDLTLDGLKQDRQQIKGFQTALDATFKACAQDSTCQGDFGGDDPGKVYDDLAASLSKTPQEFEFPLPDGTKAKRLMTLSKLEQIATYGMYSTDTRMLFMRALAAAHHGDLVPIARLLYAMLDYDPLTEKWTGDPTFSDTDFMIVGCGENNYYTGTPDERAQQAIKQSQDVLGTIPRLDGGEVVELPCIYWPGAPSQETSQPPLVAKGVPTLVLNATLDPATPFQGGKDVFSRLDQGYHIYVDGGAHGSYGRRQTCPDEYVTNLLVSGQLPSQKEIECTWTP